MDEKKVTGASYLINFFKDVQLLTHHNAQYLNILLELENRYPEDISKMDDQHKTIYIQWVQNLRYYAYKCWIGFRSLQNELKINDESKNQAEKIYKHIKSDFSLNREELEDYVVFFNEIIVQQADLKKLLESSESYVNSIFESDKENTEVQQ